MRAESLQFLFDRFCHKVAPLSSFDDREPLPGNEFRVNIYRLQGPQEDRDFLAWRPTGVWNPHHPEVFGIMRLTGK